MTMRPPPGSRPSEVKTASISASLRTRAMIGSTLSDRAADSNEGRKYDPIDMIAPRALLMIVGTEAVTSWMASEAFIAAREPKEVFWVEGATHVSLYDKDEHVTSAIAKLDPFFKAGLTSAIDPQPAE